ncbi:EF-P beta-lysylation protein EpmB [Candidatus Schmidhempelia bombi]|jgi:L-lysine 2,3-aminomutase|uniref:L-lysine 2,3-aminomutase n=1 Tax=Candidatus Schmidhempelia bombi str. Bimp TaxID=1387197 RepID=A0AB94ID13_9GAMM|nr:EF-P beta-lysylation protein EpmB [Candidatus Schmidhempelia bombi]TEA27313.1 EF-P beta-lysylation protein EpmB [Candidatus Schmidhempelia bombi str. Bimp]
MSRIIQQIEQVPNKEAWILQLANVITDPQKLLAMLALDPTLLTTNANLARKQFALRVPQSFIQRMRKGDPNDPLLLQVLHSEKELVQQDGFSHDPLQEQNNSIPGLLHKYKNRALFITKTNCAINCRYCFRRHFPYLQNQGNKQNWLKALAYIANHPELDEIILSGGDPLMAKDHELKWLIEKLEAIPHIKRLRIHTRLAVVIPERITAHLCQLLAQSRLQMIMVTHINHANEIDQQVESAMLQLKQHGVTLLNQSVLLKNINDNAITLMNLSNRLFDSGILPYYLHVLDKVQGAAHFMVDDTTAYQIMRELETKVSGYLLPKLIREIGGEKSKTILNYH